MPGRAALSCSTAPTVRESPMISTDQPDTTARGTGLGGGGICVGVPKLCAARAELPGPTGAALAPGPAPVDAESVSAPPTMTAAAAMTIRSSPLNRRLDVHGVRICRHFNASP